MRPSALELWRWTATSFGLGDSPKTEYVALEDPSTTFDGTFSDNFSGTPVSNERKEIYIKKEKTREMFYFCLNIFPLYDPDLTSYYSWSLCNLFDAIQIFSEASHSAVHINHILKFVLNFHRFLYVYTLYLFPSPHYLC